MLIELHKKTPAAYCCIVKGRTLAPMMNILDNSDELNDLVGPDNWDFDPRSGIVYLPDLQYARFDNIVVLSNERVRVYDNWDDLRDDYEVGV